MSSHDSYSPPVASVIATTQDAPEALRLISAQRKWHAISKRWSLFRYAGIGLIGMGAPVLTAVEPGAATAVGALASAWIFLSRTLVRHYELRFSWKAVAAQDAFDRLVFAMPAGLQRPVRNSPEEIRRLVGDDEAIRKYVADEDLDTWYPIETGVTGTVAVAIAQRANAAYAERLLALHANIWLGSVAGWAAVATVISVIANFTVGEFLLGVLLPLLPALLDAYDQWVFVRRASKDRRALADEIESAINDVGQTRLTGTDLLIWQDQMFVLRRDTTQVPDFLYRRTREANESAMHDAAARLAATARAAGAGA